MYSTSNLFKLPSHAVISHSGSPLISNYSPITNPNLVASCTLSCIPLIACCHISHQPPAHGPSLQYSNRALSTDGWMQKKRLRWWDLSTIVWDNTPQRQNGSQQLYSIVNATTLETKILCNKKLLNGGFASFRFPLQFRVYCHMFIYSFQFMVYSFWKQKGRERERGKVTLPMRASLVWGP